MSVMVKVEISLDDSRLTIMYHEVWMASLFIISTYLSHYPSVAGTFKTQGSYNIFSLNDCQEYTLCHGMMTSFHRPVMPHICRDYKDDTVKNAIIKLAPYPQGTESK